MKKNYTNQKLYLDLQIVVKKLEVPQSMVQLFTSTAKRVQAVHGCSAIKAGQRAYGSMAIMQSFNNQYN